MSINIVAVVIGVFLGALASIPITLLIAFIAKMKRKRKRRPYPP